MHRSLDTVETVQASLGVERLRELPWLSVVDLSPPALEISDLTDPIPDQVTTVASLAVSGEFPWTHFMRNATPEGVSLICSLSTHSVVVLPAEGNGRHGGVIEKRLNRSGCLGRETPRLKAGPINEELSRTAAGILIRLGVMPPDEYWD